MHLAGPMHPMDLWTYGPMDLWTHEPVEQHLHSQLNLARRTRIAGREPRCRDHAEAGAADGGNPSRLTEVRVVEQVEGLEPELEPRTRAERRPLGQREVHVREPGADDDVPAEIAEVERPVRGDGQREDRARRARA